jgi:hypothetical protein
VFVEFAAEGKKFHASGASVTQLGCNMDAPFPTLQEEVQMFKAKPSPKLTVKAGRPQFKVGDLVDLRIETGEALNLYCLAISPDDTATVYLPSQLPGVVSKTKGRGSWPFPGRDFGLETARFSKADEDLIGCFGSREPLPKQLAADWQAAWCKGPEGYAVPKPLDRNATISLVQRTRDVPGVVESYDWLRVTGGLGAASPVATENPCVEAAAPAKP